MHEDTFAGYLLLCYDSYSPALQLSAFLSFFEVSSILEIAGLSRQRMSFTDWHKSKKNIRGYSLYLSCKVSERLLPSTSCQQ